MVLVDSSSWIHFLRPGGEPHTRARVEDLLRSGEACWCAMIRLELSNSAGGERDHRILREFDTALPDLTVDEPVWALATELARRARRAGVSVPASDLLIAACARHHGVGLETADSDFQLLARLVD